MCNVYFNCKISYGCKFLFRFGNTLFFILVHLYPISIINSIVSISAFFKIENSRKFFNLFRSRSPPPLTRKLSREALEAHDGDIDGAMGLSRTSALNNRYFEDKGTKSRSLDNLLDNPSNVKVRF